MSSKLILKTLLYILLATKTFASDSTITKSINNVEIIFEIKPQQEFKTHSNCFVKSVSALDINSIYKTIHTELLKYSNNTLNQNLERIFVYRQLKYKHASLTGLLFKKKTNIN